VERICNRVAIINEGKLLYQGGVESLIKTKRMIKIRVEPLEKACRLLSRDPSLVVNRNGSNSIYVRMRDDDISRVNALLVTNEIRVMELTPQRATLEEVFLTLTGSKVVPSLWPNR
jgi:ABC-2 type transport system ATP-binding protein